MDDWANALPAFLVSATALIVPGLIVILAGWGWRRIGLLFLSPVISAAIVAVAAIAAPVVGLGWSWIPVLVVTAVAAATAFAVGRWAHQPAAERPALWPTLATVGAFIVGGAVIALQLAHVFVAPANISQTFDAIVHLNTAAFAVQTADASAFHIGATSDIPFYPNGWHSIVSLSAITTGAPVAVAVNATNIAIGAVAWPASCIALAAAFFPRRPAALIVTAGLATGFGAFPILLFWFGVLYPNAMAYAVLPGGLAIVWLLCRETQTRARVLLAVLLIVACAGIGLGHPNAFLALYAFGAALVFATIVPRLIRRRGRRYGRGRRAALFDGGALLAVVVVGALIWKYSRTGFDMSRWGPWQSTAQSFGEALLASPRQYPITIVVSVLLLAGIAAAVLRRRFAFVLAPFAVAALLFMLAAGTGVENPIRELLTNPWYNDPYRLAALLPVAAIPVATAGALWIFDGLRTLGDRSPFPRLAGGAIAVAGVLAVFSVGFGPNVSRLADDARGSYTLDASSALLTADEAALLDRLDRLDATVPEGAVILVNPWTGGSLAYALAGREVSEMHVFGLRSEDQSYVDQNLSRIDTDPEVCDAVDRLGSRYVLDFGDQNVFNSPGSGLEHAGLDNLPASTHLSLVDAVGAARLFRIDGC